MFTDDLRLLGGTSGLCGIDSSSSIRPTGPIFISGPRPRHPLNASHITQFNLSRPPKVKRQKSRTCCLRSSDNTNNSVTTSQATIEGSFNNNNN